LAHGMLTIGSCAKRFTLGSSLALALRSTTTFSTANPCPLDDRTTASGISIRCSFGSVTVNERDFPGRMGKSPERHQPERERFHTVPWPWNGPAWYVTEHCTGNRR